MADAGAWFAGPHRPPGVGRRGMVATSSPLAAMAGMRAFEHGGNATDAALAAAAVLAVVEPNQSGLGGDLFALVVRDGERPAGLNASGRAPADPAGRLPEMFGPTSVTMPGCVAGWADLATRCSRLGLSEARRAGDPARRGRLHDRSEKPRGVVERLGRALRRRRPSLRRPRPVLESRAGRELAVGA